MTTITISYPARDVDEVAVGTQLYSRFLGVSGRAWLIFAFVGPILSVGTLTHVFTDLDMLRTEILVLAFAVYGGIITWLCAGVYFSKRLRRHVDQASYRDGQTTWHISPEGCFMSPEYGLKWADLTKIHHFNKMTVLDFAVRRAVVVPDKALPDGMTPQDFADLITALADG